MSRLFARIWQDRTGGPAAEFALVLPVLLLFLFGMVDVGRLMWVWNQAEKATQMGVRVAVVTSPVSPGIASYSYATDGGLPQGDVVPQMQFGGIECDAAACTCLNEGGNCPDAMVGAANIAAFNAILDATRGIKGDVTANDLVVDYRYSGLGFAGDPNGPDVAPLVTVRLRNLTFMPMILFGATELDLPGFAATLTMEGGGSTTS